MSPESLKEEGGTIRASTDVWSLACILYAWTYGEPPFGRITSHMKKWIAIQDENERIHFHETIEIIETVTDPAAPAIIKGSGVAVSITASGCTITRTYPSMPDHLVGVSLPHRSQRHIDPSLIDVLRRCLQRYPPSARPTTAQLMQHPYLRGT
jgi:serine/threonine protein kinase